MSKQRPMGEIQRKVLLAMRSHGGIWYLGCGWVWNNPSGTERIMKSLERRGLVTSEQHHRDSRKYTLKETTK